MAGCFPGGKGSAGVPCQRIQSHFKHWLSFPPPTVSHCTRSNLQTSIKSSHLRMTIYTHQWANKLWSKAAIYWDHGFTRQNYPNYTNQFDKFSSWLWQIWPNSMVSYLPSKLRTSLDYLNPESVCHPEHQMHNNNWLYILSEIYYVPVLQQFCWMLT